MAVTVAHSRAPLRAAIKPNEYLVPFRERCLGSLLECVLPTAACPLTTHGPLRFAKGPLYFLSTSLVEELLSSEWLRSDFNATVRSIDQYEARVVEGATSSRHSSPGILAPTLATPRAPSMATPIAAPTATPIARRERGLLASRSKPRSARRLRVWEDVYTGYALARLVVGGGLALVESGFGNGRPSPHYSDGYGTC